MVFQTVSWFIVCLTTVAAYGRFVGTLRDVWGLSPSWSAEAFGTLWCLMLAAWGTCGALQRPALRRHQLLGAVLAIALCGSGLGAAVAWGWAVSWQTAFRELAPQAAVELALPALALLVWAGARDDKRARDHSARFAIAAQVAGLLLFFLHLRHGSELPIVWLWVAMPGLLYARSCAYHLLVRPAGWQLRACLGLLAALLCSVPAL
jgi:hypothetical protein